MAPICKNIRLCYKCHSFLPTTMKLHGRTNARETTQRSGRTASHKFGSLAGTVFHHDVWTLTFSDLTKWIPTLAQSCGEIDFIVTHVQIEVRKFVTDTGWFRGERDGSGIVSGSCLSSRWWAATQVSQKVLPADVFSLLARPWGQVFGSLVISCVVAVFITVSNTIWRV